MFTSRITNRYHPQIARVPYRISRQRPDEINESNVKRSSLVFDFALLVIVYRRIKNTRTWDRIETRTENQRDQSDAIVRDTRLATRDSRLATVARYARDFIIEPAQSRLHLSQSACIIVSDRLALGSRIFCLDFLLSGEGRESDEKVIEWAA